MSDNLDLIIVGAGNIAEQHLKVALSFKLNVELIGRGEEKVKILRKGYSTTNISSGGIDKWLSSNQCPKRAIVAVPIEYLFDVCQKLIKSGADYILVEKPLTFSVIEIDKLIKLEDQYNAKVNIAYNRRFYSSIIRAKQILKEDGGSRSMYFDFTEALFRMNPEFYALNTLSNWGISNSSHVVDSAFFLAGAPKSLNCHIEKGQLDWHPSGDRFSGSGITRDEAIYSYTADWSSPGRWYISVCSKNYKMIFSPMEKLHIQEYGSFDIYEEELDDIDLKYKPGFYRQFETWMGFNKEYSSHLLGLLDYSDNLGIFKSIFGYK